MTEKAKGPSNIAGLDIIIVNYNGCHFLDACLTSLRRQSYSGFQTWLVDNHSTDGSVEFVQAKFPWVQTICGETNVGFCAANNLAIRRATGEAVVLLNNDTVVDPDWLRELLRAAEERPDVGICVSRILQMNNPDVIYAAGDGYTAYGVAYRRGEGLSAAGRFQAREEVFSACGCAVLYRRSMLEEVGLLDEDFFSNFDDVDLAFRAQLQGYSCLYVPTSIVYHYGSGTSGVGNARVEFLSSRNSEYVFFKNMPAVLLAGYLPVHAMLMLRDAVRAARAGLLVPNLKGKVAFLINSIALLKKRRKIQKARSVSLRRLTHSIDLVPLKLARLRRFLTLFGSQTFELRRDKPESEIPTPRIDTT